MTKAALRAELRERRAAFAANAPAFLSEEDAAAPPPRLEAWLRAARCVSGYVPMRGEADPLPLLARAAAMGIATALPHIAAPGGPMRFLAWRPGDPLIAGAFGLRQPDPAAPECALGLILTPLLGFDRRLHRLGYGAGYYDAAFAANPEARRVGIAWSAQEVGAIPVDHWDIALDALWTEREWIEAEDGRP